MNNLALHKLSYGLYVLTTSVDNTPFGCIINTAFQITSSPAQIAVSCNRDNFTHDKIAKSGKFAISVLAEDSSQELIGTFGYKSGKDIDKFKDHNYSTGSALSLPIFCKEAVATFECKVVNKLEVGTHTIFIGEVADCNIDREEADEMTYRYFHEILKGVAPKNAPTYIENSSEKNNEEWECSLCKFVYDEDTPFEDLPDTWVCPVCGAEKSLFNKL